MKDWRKLYARQNVGSRRMLDDVGQAAVRWITEGLVEDVLEQIELDHAAQIGPIELSVIDHTFERDLVAWLVEVLALDLVTPNPFPTIDLVRPWLRAQRDRWSVLLNVLAGGFAAAVLIVGVVVTAYYLARVFP